MFEFALCRACGGNCESIRGCAATGNYSSSSLTAIPLSVLLLRSPDHSGKGNYINHQVSVPTLQERSTRPTLFMMKTCKDKARQRRMRSGGGCLYDSKSPLQSTWEIFTPPFLLRTQNFFLPCFSLTTTVYWRSLLSD